MSAPRSGRRIGLAAAVAGMFTAPLAVVAVAAPAHAAPVDIQILATNDFHGRLLPNTSFGAQEAGAAQFAGAVKQLESDYPDSTVFTAAGDLIGASTFESFIQHDKPTLDAFNAAGLDVSAAGNHEFDQGTADLVNRVMAPYNAVSNPEGGAQWQYLAANVRDRATNDYALPDVAASPGTSDGGTWMTTMNGVDVGFVGAVTEDLPSLVSPSGISDVVVTDIVDEVNAGADALRADGADLVIMLVHEGAATTDASALTDGSTFAQIVSGVDDDVDAIVSGHTHLAYNHTIDGRPVVSAGQYGTNLNKLVFSVDPVTEDVQVVSQDIVQANTVTVTDAEAVEARDEVAAIVADAEATAEVLGARELGNLEGPFNRARLANGNENRGGESTLGNLVAEVQRWATSDPSAGGAQIAFMNPGGLRADMVGNNAGGYPAVLTYKQAALVQPFANTLVNMKMTGADIKTLLEQQWQRDANGNVPTRPFLRLGTSEGFHYTYDPARPEGDRITGMRLDGQPLSPGTTYSVTANSFLASGGDNFRAFGLATDKRDSGRIDLQAMVDYMAAQTPVALDAAQHAVGVSFETPPPASFEIGDRLRFELSSLAMTAPGDPQDARVQVRLGSTVIGTVPVDNSIGTDVFDEYGTASVDLPIPHGVAGGTYDLTVVGTTTGTNVTLPLEVTVVDNRASAVVTAKATPDSIPAGTGRSSIDVEVTGGQATATGTVAALLGGEVIGGANLVNGAAAIPVGPFDVAGAKSITVRYYGDDYTKPADGSADLEVTPAPVVVKDKPTLAARVVPAEVTVNADGATVSLAVTKQGGTPTGAVLAMVDGVVVGAAELAGGRAEISLLPFTEVGTHTVRLKYFGDDSTQAGATTARVKVVKADARVRVRAPKRVRKGQWVKFKVAVTAPDHTPSGKVALKVRGKRGATKIVKSLRNGRVTFGVRLRKPGKNTVKIRYRGDDQTNAATRKVRVRVRRR